MVDQPDFRTARGRLQTAEAKFSEIQEQAASERNILSEKQQRLATLEQQREDNLVAARLGGTAPHEKVDPAEIEQLRVDIPVHERVAAALEERVESAKAKRKELQDAYRLAAHEHLYVSAVMPAREKFTEAFFALRDAGIELMGAHHATFHRFPRRDSDISDIYRDAWGPAGRFLNAMSPYDKELFAGYPYSVYPEGLKTGRIGDLPGVKEAEQRTLAMLDEPEPVEMAA